MDVSTQRQTSCQTPPVLSFDGSPSIGQPNAQQGTFHPDQQIAVAVAICRADNLRPTVQILIQSLAGALAQPIVSGAPSCSSTKVWFMRTSSPLMLTCGMVLADLITLQCAYTSTVHFFASFTPRSSLIHLWRACSDRYVGPQRSTMRGFIILSRRLSVWFAPSRLLSRCRSTATSGCLLNNGIQQK